MPVPRRAITLDGAREEISARSFGGATIDLDERVGFETEWFCVDPADPARYLDPDAVADCLPRSLPAGGRITFEPGGQLELSSLPQVGLPAALTATAADLSAITDALGPVGIELRGGGIDPHRPPRRFTTAPRYVAMEAFFDLGGPDGRVMMGATASLQVNVDGTPDRWRLAHAAGPALVAAFANSAIAAGRPTGWASSRQSVWSRIDPGRTAPVTDWATYALAADVMCVRLDGDAYVPLRESFPLERWIIDGHDLGWPTLGDVAYHLTTLFPPVRPRGWLEIRYLDAPHFAWWPVPAAVVSALLLDRDAGAAAGGAVAGTEQAWVEAARHGLAHPDLAEAASGCFAAAVDALPRLGADDATIAACTEYSERYVRRRCNPIALQMEVPAWT